MSTSQQQGMGNQESEMNVNDLTIGQAKELVSMFGAIGGEEKCQSLNGMIGKKVIIRTYSAGVFFGVLQEKSGSEVILANARRLWRWLAVDGITLSEVAMNGVVGGKSKISSRVDSIWLDVIEIIPCSDIAAEIIEGCENAKAS